MELMSPLLLFALTLASQALGTNNIRFPYDTNNDSMFIKKRSNVGKNIMLNVNTQASNSIKSSDLQTVFTDPSCHSCNACMGRAVNAHKIHNHIIKTEMTVDHFQDQENIIREKRSMKFDNVPKIDKKTKKSKSKRNKSVSVIKYNENSEIYALKVKETSNQLISDQENVTKTFSSTTCQVYSVQQSLPCESPEADLILSAKRKTNKKNKKVQGKKETNVPTEKATLIASVFRKRHVDNSQVPEHFMTSLEEMY